MIGYTNSQPDRLLSLDVFRGITMFLLAAEGTHLYYALTDLTVTGTFWRALVEQFHHHPWKGLRFWDLIQPFFMFIVGVSMAYSVNSRRKRGTSWRNIRFHLVKRAAILFLLGVGLHCGYSNKLVWELWNVLTQLAFTTLIAMLLFNYSYRWQLAVSIIILLAYDMCFRFWPVAGFDQPFVIDQNFGSWMDIVLMGKLNNGGGWVTINFLSTAAHTIWGVLVGELLISDRTGQKKLRLMVYYGLAAVVLGLISDWVGITPIIKRIATSSFVLVTGGLCLLTLSFFYWFVDLKGYRNWTWFFTVVGMNSIFIYLFSNTIGEQWFNGFIAIFSKGLLAWTGAAPPILNLVNSLVVLGLEWSLCYLLYRRKIFFKI